eukprot:TRINITY_DN6615_c0_g1_i3.p1 TRINITY_DN6615_c0_g1~~TRINITY_DN6615_c0_g1_i3.p1  ORF type:complete len:148 (+),score=27.51 TRINITY_DN6615_c0_g1_i3:30-446(+)
MRALPLSSSNQCCPPTLGVPLNMSSCRPYKSSNFRGVSVLAKLEEKDENEEPKMSKQSLFGSLTDALDFSQVRSAEDALLLEEAREATKSGEKMTKEQWTVSMLRKDGLTRLAKCARKIRKASQGKWTTWGDMSTWRV